MKKYFKITKNILFKAAVCNFDLFVAIYVWKPGIAVSCRIIFRARGLWSGVPARLQHEWI